MTLVAPNVWVAGAQKTTAARLNTLTDAISQLQGGAPGTGALDFFTASQAAAQTGLATGTFVSITFGAGSEVLDAAAGHSETTNTSRYVGKTAGYYRLAGSVAFDNVASGTYRAARFALNGTAINGSRGLVPVTTSTVSVVCLATPVLVYMNGTTDYVELQGSADYASWATIVATETRSVFSVQWVHS